MAKAKDSHGRIAGARATKEPLVSRSSGNVFLDIGFPPEQAAHMLLRSDLTISIRKELKHRQLTQVAAAGLLGVTQPRVSDLVRGRIELFSIDTLVEFLVRLGIKVELRTKAMRSAGSHAA